MHQAVKESSRARRYLLEGTWGKVVVEWGEKCWQEGSGFSVPASERRTESQLAKRPRFTVGRFKLHHNQSSVFKPLMSSHFFSFFLSEPVDSNIVCLYIIPIFSFYCYSCCISSTATWTDYSSSPIRDHVGHNSSQIYASPMNTLCW